MDRVYIQGILKQKKKQCKNVTHLRGKGNLLPMPTLAFPKLASLSPGAQLPLSPVLQQLLVMFLNTDSMMYYWDIIPLTILGKFW